MGVRGNNSNAKLVRERKNEESKNKQRKIKEDR
jgi:hypothetical protein